MKISTIYLHQATPRRGSIAIYVRIFWACSLLLFASGNAAEPDLSINFKHLFHLTETVTLEGQSCDLIHIYADYPEYHWNDANNEGTACLDDAARAAVVYLRYSELTQTDSLEPRIKRLFNFILFLQAPDGEFYNFIDAQLKINTTGVTSRKSFSFWAARGYWALGMGYRYFCQTDPEFAIHLKTAFLKCQRPLKRLLRAYDQYKIMNDQRYPQWLIQETGADATAEFLLGMGAYLQVVPNAVLADMALKLAAGIVVMQQPADAPYAGAFLSWPDLWHAWGNAQTQALATLGQVLNRPDLIQAARSEADAYYSHVLIAGRLKEWTVAAPNVPQLFPQIAYDIRCQSLGLLCLFEATGNPDYAILAGLTASWFLGNNVARKTMYDATTGRGFDGINDSLHVNQNAGAESTIETLYTLIEIQYQPLARPFVFYQRYRHGKRWDNGHQTTTEYRIFSGPAAQKMVLFKNPPAPKFRLSQDARVVEEFLKVRD